MKIQQVKAVVLMTSIALASITYSDGKILATQEKQNLEKELTTAIKERNEAKQDKNPNKFIQAQKKFLLMKQKLSERS